MSKRLFSLAAIILLSAGLLGARQRVNLHDLAVKVSDKGLSSIELGHYMGTCLYQGMAELAIESGLPEDMERIMSVMDMFREGRIDVVALNSYSYFAGGQAAPLLALNGRKSLMSISLQYADSLWNRQARTSDNIMTANTHPSIHRDGKDGFWIDMAFTITPYLLYSGMLSGNREYIDYSVWMILKMYEILYDKDSDGLLHQARGINGLEKGEISEDCWSRGNGWASMAFAAGLRSYPKDGIYSRDLRRSALEFYKAVLKHQDPEGLWHQEMTDFDSYVEISGSALLLAGIGAAIETGVLDRKKYLPAFEKGLKAMLGYVDPDGSVGQSCTGTLVPGTRGLKSEYEIRHHYFNEPHSFGPVALALVQAMRLGYEEVDLDFKPGFRNDAHRPRTYCKFVTERKEDFAWENDRVAFRVYSRAYAPDKLMSGVDLWPKSVDYSIIDKWYEGNLNGISYHIDRGEGCDFYNMGKGRGIGGIAFARDGSLVPVEAYSNWRISDTAASHIEFTLSYQPVNVSGDMYYASQTIEMVNGTPFYKVTASVESLSGDDIVLAVGLGNFGKAAVTKSPDRGVLSLVEEYSHKDGIIGRGETPPRHTSTVCCGVIVNPLDLEGFESCGNDEYVLVRVKSGGKIVYYVGASWSGQIDGGEKTWNRNLERNSWERMNELYAPVSENGK